MDALHARYPFRSAAREAVDAAAVGLAEIAREEPVVERATDRVRSAIESGTVGAPHRSSRVELLSYPIARVLVSLLDEPGLTRRYAQAEAATAIERFAADHDDAPALKSVERTRLELRDLLDEFDLEEAVGLEDPVRVEVGTYLKLSADLPGDRWRLVTRELADGELTVTREELFDLLERAIQDRVEDGLPLSVPDGVTDGLDGAVAELRERLADVSLEWDFEAVEPDLFPPCVTALLERTEAGEDLPAHSQFALAAFLVGIGMDTDEVADRLTAHPSIDDGTARGQIAKLRDGESAAYPMPSCATMQEYGDCVNMDALCERVFHPLEYYDRRLDGDDGIRQKSRPESQ